MNVEIEKKEVTVTEVRDSTETLYCDVCKRMIYKRDLCFPNNNDRIAAYWTVTTGHNDWGNDSIDSRKTFCLCSADCLESKFAEYIKISSRALATDYFEVERDRQRVMERGDTTND